MPIQLTPDQQRGIKSDAPTEVTDAQGQQRYVLLPQETYEALVDDRDQARLRSVSAQHLAKRLKEED